MNELFLVFISMIVGGAVGAAIGYTKGKLITGLWVGALFGLFGWIIILCLPKSGPVCQYCKSVYNTGASHCNRCGKQVS